MKQAKPSFTCIELFAYLAPETKHCVPGCLSLGLISVSTGIAVKVVFA